SGVRPEYQRAAAELGREIAQAGMGVVYGGAHVGLMGAVADAALAAGGEVSGVIPRALLERELAHTGLNKLHVVGSMHERKAMMADLADAFVLLPGGFGSWEEFCEVITWSQLGLHQKPCGVLNVSGYYDALLSLCSHAVKEGFVRASHGEIVIVAETASDLLARLACAPLLREVKWVTKQER
ncbi:MAG: TIGR00730 family Rossman fold protein, partial [Candidatus Acidiferrales bacterium]